MEKSNGSDPGGSAQPATPESAAYPRKVVLIGMMGAGKTTVGRETAARAGRPFVDVDAVIESECGTSIAELFRTHGEVEFRRRELDCIRRLVATPGPHIIAAGGGAFCQEGVRQCLAGQAVTVFLRVDEDEILRRLREADAGLRPILGGNGWESRIAGIVRERYPLYELADLILPIGNEPPETTCSRLLELLAAPPPETPC
ncbi:MAG: shikimate kinase [Planctomycetaceae bacterium]|nr:shikimate kinase [Planctomycetaceae bacterium]